MKGQTEYNIITNYNGAYYLVRIEWINGKPKIEKFNCDELVKNYKNK